MQLVYTTDRSTKRCALTYLRFWRRWLVLVNKLRVMMDEPHASPVDVEDQVFFRYSSLLLVFGVVEHLDRPALDQVFEVDDVNRLG